MDVREMCRAAGIGVVAASEHVGPPRLHRALPSLSARLVVSLGTPLDVRYDGHARHTRAVLAGMMRPGVATPSLMLRPHQPTVYVDLSPLAMWRLTGAPPSEVDAGGVDAEAVLPWVGRLAEELADHPADQREPLMRVRLLERLKHDGQVAVCDDALEALRVVGVRHGRVSVAGLARHVRLSPRRLRYVMRRDLGVGPKFAGRVARLSGALSRAGDGAGSWAEVAAECAYHDQSHLVREFTDLMETTPTTWLAEEGRNLQGWRRPSP